MKVISLTLARGKIRNLVYAPPIEPIGGWLIESDSSVPEDEVWFVGKGGVIQKCRIGDENE